MLMLYMLEWLPIELIGRAERLSAIQMNFVHQLLLRKDTPLALAVS